MPERPSRRDEAVSAVAKYGSVRRASLELGVPRSTLRGWVKVGAPSTPVPVAEDRDILALRRHADQITGLKKSLKDAQDRAIRAEETLAKIEGARHLGTAPPRWASAPSLVKRKRMLPLLFTSDFQLGEVIQADEIDGMNDYNPDIFSERYAKLIDRTIELALHNTGDAEFPGVFYLRGGDAISGGIHLELQDTDDLSAVPAVEFLIQHEKEGIRRLREQFGRVRVFSIPGNHGRIDHKPRSKGYTERNYETLLAWCLARQFDDDPNVEFIAPKSGFAYFEAEGHKCLMAHGDRMGSRGGTGFIGPAATIARGHQKLKQSYETAGKPLDLILTGHLHTSLKLQFGYANGSVAGYSEYARDLQAAPDAAKQWLLMMNEDEGVSLSFEIPLSERPLRRFDRVSRF